MVSTAGIEPATWSLEGSRSIQLSYVPALLIAMHRHGKYFFPRETFKSLTKILAFINLYQYQAQLPAVRAFPNGALLKKPKNWRSLKQTLKLWQHKLRP